ncbi:MAG: hypothetical protein V8R91_01275, partial [Butyricimonas faecihominis]
ALRRLKEGGRFEELTTEDIATCENINRKILDLSRQQTADTNAFQAVIAGNSMLYGKLNAYRSMPEVRETGGSYHPGIRVVTLMIRWYPIFY